jgi:hypothetical protein
MKKILKAFGKTLAYLAGAVFIGLTPVILDRLFGTIASIIVVFGSLTAFLFYVVYLNEKD